MAYELERQGKVPGAIRFGRRIVVSRKKLEDTMGIGQAMAEVKAEPKVGRREPSIFQ